jgi:hypothetical protein
LNFVKQTILRQFSGKSAAAGLLALAATVLLVARWTYARPLWLDEEMIAVTVRGRGLFDLHGPLWLGQSAPLGWLMLERCALLLFGAGERSLRALPVAFGVATAWTAVRVGRRWMGALGAASLVFFCAFGTWASYFALELKPYSADLFFGLALPALAAWAIDAPPDDLTFGTRVRRWWTAAAAAQFLSNGALLVTPTSGLVLAFEAWRRRGWRGLVTVIVPAAGWTCAFALHYALTSRFALGSRYLRDYWSFALPPAGSSVADRLRWLFDQLHPFALKPAGSDLTDAFWIAAAAGLLIAFRLRRSLGLAFAPVPLAGFLFAAARVVPLYERLSLWILPSLYVGVSVLGDQALQSIAGAIRQRRWVQLGVAAAAATIFMATLVGTARTTHRERYLLRPGGGNHQLDDRAAVRWLMARREPGDIVITSRLAEPAIWWYADVSLAEPGRGRRQSDGSPILEVSANGPADTCDPAAFETALHGRRRALVYLGFRFDDQPKAFDDLLLWRLSDFGAMTAYRGFAERSRVAVFDLTAASSGRQGPLRPDVRPEDPAIPAGACLSVAEAERW